MVKPIMVPRLVCNLNCGREESGLVESMECVCGGRLKITFFAAEGSDLSKN